MHAFHRDHRQPPGISHRRPRAGRHGCDSTLSARISPRLGRDHSTGLREREMADGSLLVAALLLAPLLAGAGCKTPDATASPVTTAEVTLLEAGTAPRTTLRLHPTKGD